MAVLVAGIGDVASSVAAVFHDGAGEGGQPVRLVPDGEVFAFRYGPVPPFITYFRFDTAGNKGPDVPIFSVQQSSFLHDFAVMEWYTIFLEI